jgi:predicted HAD superfamily Cof-like phosphohydrolase|tara:strand:- start:310 stop:693 length:384 start_codon:yes stop_codon:yes gene_type:complete
MSNETVETKLRHFHKVFNHPVDQEYPEKHIVDKLKNLRTDLIVEEFDEVMDAIQNRSAEDVLKEMCDLVYVVVGFAVTYGFSFDAAFNRVHASNLSKLDEQGRPVYRKDGKVQKSNLYVPPRLKDLL